ncbi:hypothetical protein GJ496_001526 [Pomphorhynchus laevis]|nr:hypothetical protein GJ496_001526 [Pomphorhynchus laevis]
MKTSYSSCKISHTQFITIQLDSILQRKSSIGQDIPDGLLNPGSIWLKKDLAAKNEDQVEKVELIDSIGHYVLLRDSFGIEFQISTRKLASYLRNDVDSSGINKCPVEQTGMNIYKNHDQLDIDEAITHNVQEGTNGPDNVSTSAEEQFLNTMLKNGTNSIEQSSVELQPRTSYRLR